MIDNDTYNPVQRTRTSREGRIAIPTYLLPRELQELHERIRNMRRDVVGMEREFNEQLRAYFSLFNHEP